MIFEDFTYRRVGDITLLGRLFKPADARAVVVEVHGGAWTMNDRTTNAAIHHHLAANGVAVFALDFRLAPAHRYPAAIEDVNCGIRWIKANAQRLGLRARLFGGLGTSSGGQQVVLAALRFDDPLYTPREPSLGICDARLDFVIACWPILDPLTRYRMAKAKGLKNLIDAHHAFWPDEQAMVEGNPQLVLERRQASATPPMLVLQGTADENVEHERAERFAHAYRALGGAIEVVKFAGQPHNFVAKDPAAPAAAQALQKMSAFVHAQLGGVMPQ